MKSIKNIENNKICKSIKDIFLDSKLYSITNSNGSVVDYNYFVYPFKGFNIHAPQYETFIANCFKKILNKDEVDLLITFESDGIGITKLISSITSIPMLICKPFHYEHECIKFTQLTGYHQRSLYLPKRLIENKKIAIVDAIVSTGGTINNFLKALSDQGIKNEIVGIFSVAHKHNYNNYRIYPKSFFGKIHYSYLIDLEIISEDNRLKTKVEFSRCFKKIIEKTD